MIVCVGIPTISGQVCSNTIDSLLAEQFLGLKQGVHFLILWEIGCSMIGVARNKIARRFLATKADCLVFVDSDISWTGGDLARLAQRPEKVIGGTYRAKREDDYYHVRGMPEKRGDLWKVDGLPGGFLKIAREAFEAIPAAVYQDADGSQTRDYFPTGMHDGAIWGEDYGFCRLWRETGGEVFLDASLKLRHHDGLKAYVGDPAKWVESIVNG